MKRRRKKYGFASVASAVTVVFGNVIATGGVRYVHTEAAKQAAAANPRQQSLPCAWGLGRPAGQPNRQFMPTLSCFVPMARFCHNLVVLATCGYAFCPGPAPCSHQQCFLQQFGVFNFHGQLLHNA